MQIEITAQKIELTDAIRELTLSKLERVTTHMQTITSIHVNFKVEKHLQIAEGQVLFPGHTVHAEASSDDLYKAIDSMIDKLVKQITKHKEKMTGHR